MSLSYPLPMSPRELTSQPDDRREVKAWPWLRVLFAIRATAVMSVFLLWLGSLLIEWAGVPLNVSVGTFRTWCGLACFGIAVGSSPLLLFFAERYREQSYAPIAEVRNRLVRYREKHDTFLSESNFTSIGTFRVNGSAFNTQVELLLGCERMVIAEFALLGQRRAIELVSMTESGRVIVTTCAGGVAGERSEQFFPNIVCTTHVGPSFERLLSTHLRKTTETSEQEDSPIAELAESDVVDVMRYYNRAYHDSRVYSGKAKDPVGPMTYGRFRFPDGMTVS